MLVGKRGPGHWGDRKSLLNSRTSDKLANCDRFSKANFPGASNDKMGVEIHGIQWLASNVYMR